MSNDQIRQDDQRWQDRLDNLGSEEEQQLLLRLRQEDPDLADALWARTVENNLDEIGLEKVSSNLHTNLYAIADDTNNTERNKQQLVKRPWSLWSAWAGVAAALVVAIMVKPWQEQHPSIDEISQARQQLAVAFFYLDKAADIARQETQKTIVYGVHTAIASSPLLSQSQQHLPLPLENAPAEIEAEEQNIEL